MRKQKRNRQSDILELIKEYTNQGNILKRRHAIMKLGYLKRMKHEIEMLSYYSEIKSWEKINWQACEAKTIYLKRQLQYNTQIKCAHDEKEWANRLMSDINVWVEATRRVCVVNKGKKSSGIDKEVAMGVTHEIVWNKRVERWEAKRERPAQEIMKWIRETKKEWGRADLKKRVYIPKPGTTEMRPLGIPTAKDRVKQMVLKIIMEPLEERKAEKESYGFREGIGCAEAISEAQEALEMGKYWVLDADIRKCFDEISHDAIKEVTKGYGRKIQEQIMAWCEAKIIEPTKEIKESKSGTPQGGVLSPLLANMVLKVIKEATPKELILIRYADDFVIFGETREEIENVQEKIKETISKVGLRIHETKTRIVNMRENDISNETGIEFLGMRIRSGKFKSVLIQPRDSALAKFKEKCEFLLGESQVMPASIEKALKDGGHIPDLQEYLGGWSEYFWKNGTEAANIAEILKTYGKNKLNIWGKV